MGQRRSGVVLLQSAGTRRAAGRMMRVSVPRQATRRLIAALLLLAFVARALVPQGFMLASEGRMSAYILSALPAFVIGLLMLIAPRFYTDKMGDPIFWPVVAVVIVVYLAGWLMIQRIVNFKY